MTLTTHALDQAEKLKRRFVTFVLTLANGKELRKRVSADKFRFAGGKAIITQRIEFPLSSDHSFVTAAVCIVNGVRCVIEMQASVPATPDIAPCFTQGGFMLPH